ncbi:hemerythrin domain-containing protein [Phenylobacterium deserti]|uniref:Hemerythrin-like domain-containing protein n=1 Tax=Phenylobacterium deserti TaxID=1914756 RepID=A0A328A9N2_9CAUL|nr:hypothetical protein [Phenylobacterium deserti]RAK51413.1 hypothetical protein DJ018_15865 [Phenylobacterium deserti]
MYDLEYEPAVANVGRWDLYGPVHKGLRLGHAQLLARLGSADWGGDVSELLSDLKAHLRLGASHIAHEDSHIHPALEARDAGATAHLEEEHTAHRARFAALDAQIAGLEVAFQSDRPALGRQLYLAFGKLVAEDLAHMHEEETQVWPRLCATHTDAELQAIEGAIIGSLPPTDVVAFMRLMIPAMNRAERAGMLGGMKAGAPPEAYRGVLEAAARPTLSADDWAHLEAEGLA